MTEPTPCLTGDLRTPGKRRAPRALQVRKLLAAAPGWYRSPNYSSRNGTKVTAAVIHTAEGPTDADSLGAYFAEVSSQVSSHVGIDDEKRVNYVDPRYEAWTLRAGNPWTENAEMCGFASWTRAQWLEHPEMIRQAAEWVAERCHALGVPPTRLTPDDIRAGRRSGYFAHWDYTRGTGDGTHWDVGTGFPWDRFDGLVQAAYNGGDDDMPLSADDLSKIQAAVWGYKIDKGVSGISGAPQPATLVLGDVFAHVRGTSALVAKMAAQDPSTVTAADIAAAIPADIAQQVVDALVSRLKSA